MRIALLSAATISLAIGVLIYDTQQSVREDLELIKLRREHQEQVIQNLLRS